MALSWILRRARRGEFFSAYYTPIDLVWVVLAPCRHDLDLFVSVILLDSMMRSLLHAFSLILAVCAGGFVYFYFRGPAIAAPANIVVEKSPERVEATRLYPGPPSP